MVEMDAKKQEKVYSLLKRIKQQKIRWIDLQFVDLFGSLQHVTLPSKGVDENSFTTGVGKLDGSSIKGFKAIENSDMVLLPDPDTFVQIPWYVGEHKTLRSYVNLLEGGTYKPFDRDTRGIAQKAVSYAKECGFDSSWWGPEPEFYVFDNIKILPNPVAARDSWGGVSIEIESREAVWQGPSQQQNPTIPIRFKEGYYPAPPQDSLMDFRNEFSRVLNDYFGITTEAHHHEVGGSGQCEVGMAASKLLQTGDNVTTFKYVAKNIGAQMGKLVTFMSKPIYGDNASGMHLNVSLWSKGKNAFYDETGEHAQLSQTALYFIGGLLDHARAMCAFTNPTVNSYRRLVPGYEAPVYIAWGVGNRSGNVRIPRYYSNNAKLTRVEYRTPDPSANIYLAQATMLAAGLDGIKKKISPPEPVAIDLYETDRHQRKDMGIGVLPGSLREAVKALESDHEFLKPVLSDELLEFYIDYKRDEHTQGQLRVTPYEYYRYLDL